MSTRVLVIDDSLLVRRQVRRVLTTAGFDVEEATDGVDALQKLEAMSDAQLVVCDVSMPRMDGIEFLERVHARGSKVPVVMLTTEGQPELLERARALGAKGWIRKPFDADLLIAAVKRLTRVG